MTVDKNILEQTIKVMENEKLCVLRNIGTNCDRNCADCKLLLPDTDIICAYNVVLAILYSFKEQL